MKIIQKNLRIVFAMFILAFVAMSCSQKEVKPNKEIVGEINPAEFQRLMTARESNKGYNFDIVGGKQDGNILKIEVLGGCAAEDYKVVWNGLVNFSMPMQTGIILSLEPKQGINCKAILNHTIIIDLKKLIGSNYDRENFLISIINGSKIDDWVINSSGVITVKK